jgi:hypothetical protein
MPANEARGACKARTTQQVSLYSRHTEPTLFVFASFVLVKSILQENILFMSVSSLIFVWCREMTGGFLKFTLHTDGRACSRVLCGVCIRVICKE